MNRIAYVASFVILYATLSTVGYAAPTATGTITGNFSIPDGSVITCSNNPTCASTSTSSTGRFTDDTLKSGQTMEIKVLPFPSTSNESFCVFNVTYTHKKALGRSVSMIQINLESEAHGYTCLPIYEKSNNNTLTTNIKVEGPPQK